MRYSEKLAEHLADRRRRQTVSRFRIGEWLETLNDADLRCISELLEVPQNSRHVNQNNNLPEDLAEVCVLALRAEQRREKVRADPDILKHLCVLASYVVLSRAGLIEIFGPLALSKNAPTPKVGVTALKGS